MIHLITLLHAQYLPSSTSHASLLPASSLDPPFTVQLQSLTPLVAARGEQTDTPASSADIRKALRRASVEALRFIQAASTKDGSSSTLPRSMAHASIQAEQDAENKHVLPDATALNARDITRDQQIPTNHIDFSTVPLPNKLLQSTLARALSEGQASRAATPTTPMRLNTKKSSELPVDVGVQRWALASLLHHYLGEGFGQVKQADGVTSYSRDDKDDIAIREIFPDPRRFSLVEADLSPCSPSISSSLAHGQESIATTSMLDSFQRDDKLKWLLGEFVPTHTVRRRTPLPAEPSRTSPRGNRMVARSPTAYQPRRRHMHEQDYLSDADLQEVVYQRRRSPSSKSAPLTPPHRRAWSADSELANLGKEDGATSPSAMYPGPRESFDTASHREWQGGSSLSRMNSYDTYDSQSRLISSRHRGSESSDSRNPFSQKALLDPVEDHSPERSPKAPQSTAFQDAAALTSRPFMNLYIARPDRKSVV